MGVSSTRFRAASAAAAGFHNKIKSHAAGNCANTPQGPSCARFTSSLAALHNPGHEISNFRNVVRRQTNCSASSYLKASKNSSSGSSLRRLYTWVNRAIASFKVMRGSGCLGSELGLTPADSAAVAPGVTTSFRSGVKKEALRVPDGCTTTKT
jgi:hypothetical protein